MANVVLTDDHILLRNALAEQVKRLGHFVVFEADNGKDLLAKLSSHPHPDLIMLDINMPEMDGFETAAAVKKAYPSIKILALSMYNDESSIIRMLKSGAKGYILKDSDPHELKLAIESMILKGHYYNELVSNKLMHAITDIEEDTTTLNDLITLSKKEIDFIRYACSELTYREIADKMGISPRTVDGYREALFLKLEVRTRIGLAMYAVKNRIVTY